MRRVTGRRSRLGAPSRFEPADARRGGVDDEAAGGRPEAPAEPHAELVEHGLGEAGTASGKLSETSSGSGRCEPQGSPGPRADARQRLACFVACRHSARRRRVGGNPYGLEGYKTVAFEVFKDPAVTRPHVPEPPFVEPTVEATLRALRDVYGFRGMTS